MSGRGSVLRVRDLRERVILDHLRKTGAATVGELASVTDALGGGDEGDEGGKESRGPRKKQKRITRDPKLYEMSEFVDEA